MMSRKSHFIFLTFVALHVQCYHSLILGKIFTFCIMHKMSSHCKFSSVAEWIYVQPNFGETKLNGFLNLFGGRGRELGIGLFLHTVL
jgi:hypothetical protein